MQKPIIAIIMGEKANSKVAKIINDANIGICYEELEHFSSYVSLNQYIKTQYNLKKQTNKLNFMPNKNELDQYNYVNIARKFEKLIEEFFAKGLLEVFN